MPPMSKEHKRILRKNEDFLKMHMSIRKRLIGILFSEEHIDRAERRAIEGRGTDDEKVEELLEILSRKEDGTFGAFINALIEDEQQHIADQLMNNQEGPASAIPATGPGFQAKAGSGRTDSATGPGIKAKADYTVMISYSWSQSAVIDRIQERLESEGFNIWRDKKDMGDNLMAGMAEALQKSSVILACLSENYATSPNCMREVKAAEDIKTRLIPLIVQKGYRVPRASELGLVLGDRLWIDVSDEQQFSTKMDEVVRRLRRDDV